MVEISKRANKTLELIKNGRFYMDYDPNLPATIKELLDAKLIRRGARATEIVAAFVPVEGYVHMRDEQFSGGWGYSEALAETAAPELLAALREIAGNGDGAGRNPQLMVDAALAAIAKAEGRDK